jgi:EAL domain-containing protein (putative c-di-GMP-specific phosphodiesterase class I)
MNSIPDRIKLPAGSSLFWEGEPGTTAYLVNSGCIEIFLLRDGSDLILAHRGPGEIVGEMAIIDNQPRSASARVIADCELVLITAERLTHRIEEADPILRMYLSVVINRYRETVAMLNPSAKTLALTNLKQPSKQDFKAALKTLSLESELRGAIENNELELFFQPIVRLESQHLVGFEALLRWNHPARGLVSPGDFVPVAEACGIITDITDWCLNQVGVLFPRIIAAALTNVAAIEPLFLSVNISGHDLTRNSLPAALEGMLASFGLDARSIKLEITESLLMKDPQTALTMLEACRARGFGIAMDDFGTGYSSLSYLSTLPITTIKIDQSFVRSMMQSQASFKIVHMLLRLAEELGLPVVAEGIEHDEEARLLADLGCTFGQGYLFGKPLALDKTLALVRAWTTRRQSVSCENIFARPAKIA